MIKSVLASLTGYGSDRTVLDTAMAVARIGAGHVEAFHIRLDTLEIGAIMGSVSTREDLQPLIDKTATQQDERSRQAKAAFDDACKRHAVSSENSSDADKVSASWKECKGIIDETFDEARYHDLAVMAREPAFSLDRLTSVLMHSGRPLLIAPPKPVEALGRNVAIAWKAGPEAARALTAAMPILRRASSVSILLVSENAAGDHIDRSTAERLAKLLNRHGIRAQVRMKYSPSGSCSHALQEMAYNDNADLLVMGAYGHSRLRQFVFGGVTRDMLADCAIPVLLCG